MGLYAQSAEPGLPLTAPFDVSQWRARITYARSLGNKPAQLAGSAASHPSAWVELGTGF